MTVNTRAMESSSQAAGIILIPPSDKLVSKLVSEHVDPITSKADVLNRKIDRLQ